jgi:hypothetical protein
VEIGTNIVRAQGLGKGLFVLLSFVALTIQCFVAQTHVHGYVGVAGFQMVRIDTEHAAGAAASHDHNAPNAPLHGHSSVADCFLCQSTVAGAGVLPTTPASIFILGASLSSGSAEASVPLLGALRSHSWRSRAPPFLQV